MVFLDNLARVQKLVLLRTIHQIVLIALLLFFGSYTLAIGFEKLKGWQIRAEVSFYLIALAAAAVCAVGYGLLRRERFIQILIGIDTRLHLQDRLSTAYEYYAAGKSSAFTDLLLADAGRRLNGFSSKQLFPPQFSSVYLLLGVLLAFNLTFSLLDRLPAAFKQPSMTPAQVSKLRSLLTSYSPKKPDAQNKTVPEKMPAQVSEKLDRLAKKLEARTLTRDELVKSLRQTLQEVQGEQTRLAQELDAKLREIENLSGVNMVKSLQFERLSANELRKMKDMLNKLGEQGTPGAMAENLSLLDEQRRLGEMLENMLADVESQTDQSNDGSADQNTATAQKGQESPNDDPAAAESDQEETSARAKSGGKNQDDGQTDARQAQAHGGAPDSGQEMPPGAQAGDDSASPTHGHETATAPDMAPHQLEQAAGPAIRDKMRAAPKDDYSAQIRSVTEIGHATAPDGQATRPYRQELESILQQETIPLNYREYIKNYFIAIGLREPQGS